MKTLSPSNAKKSEFTLQKTRKTQNYFMFQIYRLFDARSFENDCFDAWTFENIYIHVRLFKNCDLWRL